VKFVLKTLILLTILHAAAFSHLQAQESSVPVVPITYRNDNNKYSVSYPANWLKKDVAKLDLFISPPLKKEEQSGPATVNFTSEEVPSDINLTEFYNESVKSLTNELKNVKIESTGDRILDGVKTRWIVYTHVLQSITYKVMQIFIINYSHLYLITASAPAEDFDLYRPEFESVISTFKFEFIEKQTQKSKT